MTLSLCTGLSSASKVTRGYSRTVQDTLSSIGKLKVSPLSHYPYAAGTLTHTSALATVNMGMALPSRKNNGIP